jgi:hypothetical protein
MMVTVRANLALAILLFMKGMVVEVGVVVVVT